MRFKQWKPGKADAIWKLMICARDANRADELIDALVGILTDAGLDTESGLARLRGMSGADIVDGIVAYKATSYESVKRAYPMTEHLA